MKTAFKQLLWMSLALACVNLLSSCVQKRNEKGGDPAAQTGAPAPGGRGAGQTPGTSDSGGGTGLDGKIFESYRVNPVNLPAYKEHIKPILRAIVSQPGEEEAIGDIEFFFAIKTWFIAPVDLEKVGKDSLGVSFFRNDTQQIARQTMKEVWISKSIFDAMSPREQAHVLLHEFVMTLYFLKFMPLTEMCKYLPPKHDSSDGCHPDNMKVFDEAFAPEPARPLNEADNENIRYITGWLLEKDIRTVRDDEFKRLLVNHGFDKRLFGNIDAKPENMKVSGKDLAGAIRGAILAGRMPSLCQARELGQSAECRVSWQSSDKTFFGSNVPVYVLSVRVLGTDQALQVKLNMPAEVELNSSTSVDFGNQYHWIQTSFLEKVTVGSVLHTVVFTFKYGPRGRYAGLELDSVIIRPGIVVSVDKKRDPVCQLISPKPTKIIEDTLLITTGRKDVSQQERGLLAMQPIGLCFEGNVEEAP